VAFVVLAVLGFALLGGHAESVPWSPRPVDETLVGLAGLDFVAFVDASYREYILRFPEWVTNLGVAGAFGVRNDALNVYSATYLEETRRLERGILDLLHGYDRATLNAEDQVTYDVSLWYWDDLVRGQAFALSDYPVSQFHITSLPWTLFDLLTEVQPIASREDADDYVSRLLEVGRQFDEIVTGLEARADAGVILPREVIDLALPEIDGLAGAPASRVPFYTSFESKLKDIAELGSQERTDLLARARSAVGDVVLPAYGRVASALRALRSRAPSQVGVGQLPNGEAYYAHLLRHYTQTNLSAEEIHEIGLREVERLRGEIQEAARAVGMPEGLSMTQIYARATVWHGTLTGEGVVAEYERLIEAAQSHLAGVIDPLPTAAVIVKGDPIGGYYRPPAADGSRPGIFYAPTSGPQPRYRLPTLAYHEAVPGHHIQVALSMNPALPLLARAEAFTSHIEGWALYAERLAWELGWYADDPYGNLGRLQDEMMRAVRLVVDTGIHAKGWSAWEGIAYFVENTGKTEGYAQYEVYRYAVWPGQSTAYMVGMLRILDLRSQAQEALGGRFDLVGFHRAVLGKGGVPLPVLEEAVQIYVTQASGG
jgi:uncharacterized protein (DUF885 family)